MNRARAPQGDNDPSGKRGEPNTAPVDINIVAIAAGMIMTLVWTFSWAQTWTALGVVFVAAVLHVHHPHRHLRKRGWARNRRKDRLTFKLYHYRLAR